MTKAMLSGLCAALSGAAACAADDLKGNETWGGRKVRPPDGRKGRRIWFKTGWVNSQGWFRINGKQVALEHNCCATHDVCIDDAWVRGDFDKREAEVHVEVEGKREEVRGCV